MILQILRWLKTITENTLERRQQGAGQGNEGGLQINSQNSRILQGNLGKGRKHCFINS